MKISQLFLVGIDLIGLYFMRWLHRVNHRMEERAILYLVQLG